jgi:hypothetical protein
MSEQTKPVLTSRATGLKAIVNGASEIRSSEPQSRISNQEGGLQRSPLADLVNDHLRSNALRQIDFCRQAGFDQGLLSKILSSVVNTLNVESALKLAEGMCLPPSVVFDAIGKRDVHETLIRLYSGSE